MKYGWKYCQENKVTPHSINKHYHDLGIVHYEQTSIYNDIMALVATLFCIATFTAIISII